MFGAIAGDVIGSRFEKNNIKTKDFQLFHKDCSFTDDTVLTVAIADAILGEKDYAENIRTYALKYPFAGYGGTFKKWMAGIIKGPYNSWGNGSAMRVSPIAWAWDNWKKALEEAKKSAAVTHNHPEGIKGAQAITMAIAMARQGRTKAQIKKIVNQYFPYELERSIESIRPTYSFDVSCQGSVPEAIIAFSESENFEDAIRTAISIGGDSDTIACMAAAIAEAHYGLPSEEFREKVYAYLPQSFIDTIRAFHKAYPVRK
ncbi:MAG: ADP-ribosylglycohydrolase family protein [Bacteroidia bacterium]|nr:ADP-ribosylglycohydrolase family protein [Bacteroidia bacterium]